MTSFIEVIETSKQKAHQKRIEYFKTKIKEWENSNSEVELAVFLASEEYND